MMNERNNLYEKTYSCDYDKIVTDMPKSNIATLRKYKFQRWEKCGSTPHRVAKKKGRTLHGYVSLFLTRLLYQL